MLQVMEELTGRFIISEIKLKINTFVPSEESGIFLKRRPGSHFECLCRSMNVTYCQKNQDLCVDKIES